MFTWETTNACSEHMVVQRDSVDTDALLCVACGWEGLTRLPAAPWTTFMQHDCRPEEVLMLAHL